MPVHDWTRVEAGVFHDFHGAWITHLKEALNGGLLPGAHYAMSEQQAEARRTLTIRHASNHRVVALLEILSPANKDRRSSVADFVDKVHAALRQGCHLLVIDLLPPGPHATQGIHEAIWETFDPGDNLCLAGQTLTLVAYRAGPLPEAFLELLRVGDALPDMPLFLNPDLYVNVPLEATYQAAYRGLPSYWRGVLEAG